MTVELFELFFLYVGWVGGGDGAQGQTIFLSQLVKLKRQ